MTTCKAQPLALFAEMSGSQAKAAELLEISESHMSLLINGKRAVTPALAVRLEVVSGGVFRREAVLWPEQAA